MINRKKEQGFTLIELLVVVAILAVLAGVAVPRVLDALSTAKKNADTANVAILQGAIERFHLDAGVYPVTGTAINWTAAVTVNSESRTFVPHYVTKQITVQGTGSFIVTNGIVSISTD